MSAEAYRIIMIGSGGVGKSAMTLQFLYDEFVVDYEPTKAGAYNKTIMLDGEEAKVDILDTAGQETYEGIRDGYIRNGEGFLMVFDITDPESFSDLIKLHEQIVRVKNSATNIPAILVGNKIDLVDQRQISSDQGSQTAHEWSVPYIETSAKTKQNVDKAYMELMKLIKPLKKANTQENVTGSLRHGMEIDDGDKKGGCCEIL